MLVLPWKQLAWVTSVAERMMTVLSLCLAVAQRFVALV
jgi:hypothetical protein